MNIAVIFIFEIPAHRLASLPQNAHPASMLSLRTRLAVLWIMLLLASAAVAVLFLQLYRQSSSAQLWRTQSMLGQICETITDRYSFYTAGWAGLSGGTPSEDASFRRDMATLIAEAVSQRVGSDEPAAVSAGIWLSGAGIIAGHPPLAAEPAINEAALAVLADGNTVPVQLDGTNGPILLRACALPGPVPDLVAWTLARFETPPGATALQWGLGVLLAVVAGSTAWLTALIVTYNRRIAAIERDLRQDTAVLPRLDPTGMPDLDRIVSALNASGQRLTEARRREAALASKLATGERLAALGRVTAGVAHELRNPMAAMRLRVENALAGDAARRQAALEAVLGQIDRLDALVAALLTMTSRRDPVPRTVILSDWLHQIVAELGAEPTDAMIRVETIEAQLQLDPDMVRLALNNLLRNARQHTPPTARITLSADHNDGWLRFTVRDTGPGVPPALRATVFEPFVTGRADGTGLGLAIAREMAEAHGGRLTLAPTGLGACFVLEIPWRAS